MRPVLFILLFCPMICHAQVNRSLKEIAAGNISVYVKEKVFPRQEYTPVSYGDIIKRDNRYVQWTITHHFIVTEREKHPGGESGQQVVFVFYLDKKFRVLYAERVK